MRELELLRGIADDVAGVVDETPTRDFGREDGIGADGDPTAYVDRLAEERVLEAVEASQLDLNVCSAVRDIPFYCVSLAIARGGLGELEVGLVRNLATGDTYEAVAGEGAWRDSRQLSTGDFDPEDAVRSPILDPDAIPGLVEEIRDVPYVRGLGAAALELALVAQGALDVFLHLRGGLRVVDIAASTLLIREAGGAVATPAGEAPEMPFDPTARTSLVAVGDPDLLSRAEVVA
jgi:fructose-1,6-bisphosphatase/inositol monophosphatase family enzyme